MRRSAFVGILAFVAVCWSARPAAALPPGINGVYNVEESDVGGSRCPATPFRSALAKGQTGPNYTYRLLVGTSPGQVTFSPEGGAGPLFVATITDDGKFKGSSSGLEVRGTFETKAGGKLGFSMDWIQTERGGLTCATSFNGVSAATAAPAGTASSGSTAAPKSKEGGGNGTPIFVLVGVGAAATAVAIQLGRRRPKFKEPSTAYATPPPGYSDRRANPWDPDVEEQRKRWDKDKVVWDPDTLSWRLPRFPDEFIDLPEDLAPVEALIPEDNVPAKCLNTYRRYIGEQVGARTMQQEIFELAERYNAADRVLRTNILRANVQLGFDVGLAVGGMAQSVAEGARAAARPATRSSASMQQAMAEAARKRMGARTAELDGELQIARSRLTKSKLEMDAAGLDGGAIRTAADEAGAELASLRARLAKLDENPPDLMGKLTEISEAQVKLTRELDRLAQYEREIGGPLRSFTQAVDRKFTASPEGQHFARLIKEEARIQNDLLKQLDIAPGDVDLLIRHVDEDVAAGRMTPAEAASLKAGPQQIVESRVRSLQLAAENDAAVVRLMKQQPGYRPEWGPELDRLNAKDLEGISLRWQLGQLNSQEAKLSLDLEQIRESTRTERARIEQDMAGAEERHQTALEKQKQYDALRTKVDDDQRAVDILDAQINDVNKQATAVENELAGMSTGAKLLSGVVLLSVLTWLSPVAGAIATVGVVSGVAADKLGIGPQSPEEIANIIKENEALAKKLNGDLAKLQQLYDDRLKTMAHTASELETCVKGPSPADSHDHTRPVPAP